MEATGRIGLIITGRDAGASAVLRKTGDEIRNVTGILNKPLPPLSVIGATPGAFDNLSTSAASSKARIATVASSLAVTAREVDRIGRAVKAVGIKEATSDMRDLDGASSGVVSRVAAIASAGTHAMRVLRELGAAAGVLNNASSAIRANAASKAIGVTINEAMQDIARINALRASGNQRYIPYAQYMGRVSTVGQTPSGAFRAAGVVASAGAASGINAILQGSRLSLLATDLAALGSAAGVAGAGVAVLGTAFAGWHVGKWISETTGLTAGIEEAFTSEEQGKGDALDFVRKTMEKNVWGPERERRRALAKAEADKQAAEEADRKTIAPGNTAVDEYNFSRQLETASSLEEKLGLIKDRQAAIGDRYETAMTAEQRAYWGAKDLELLKQKDALESAAKAKDKAIAETTKSAITALDEQVEIQKLLNNGKEREAAIEKAIADARKSGISEDALIDIAEKTGELYDLQQHAGGKKSGSSFVGPVAGLEYGSVDAFRAEHQQNGALDNLVKTAGQQLSAQQKANTYLESMVAENSIIEVVDS